MAYGMQPQSDPTAVMGRRIVAYILDGLLAIGVLIAVLALSKHTFFQNAPDHACQTLADRGFSGQCAQIGSHVYAWDGNSITNARIASLVAGFADLVVLQGLVGASIGKLILGLRVVNGQGEPCGLGRAFLRWIFLLVDGACFLVGLIVALATHPHRRIGDMVAGTYVVGLASAGRPILSTPVPPPYAYSQPGAPAWAPPGSAPPPPPSWGATPPAAWGAPTDAPPPPPPPEWGAPTDPPPPPTWSSPATPPAPPSTPQDRSGWGTAPSTWGAPPPATESAAPTPAPPTEPTEPTASLWGTPDPAADRSGWGPPASPPDTPPTSTPTEPVPPPPTEPPPPPPAGPAPGAPGEGESWWSKAFGEDDEPEQ